jgi:hypothetical protein
MRTAIALMCVGAALMILSAIVFFATIDRYANAVTEVNGAANQAWIDRAVSHAERQEIFRTLIAVCLWIWMAVKNGQGRKWARVVATVFGVINVVGFAFGGALVEGSGSDALSDYVLPYVVMAAISVVLGIVILVQLYRPDSSRYYNESKRYTAAMTLRGYR